MYVMSALGTALVAFAAISWLAERFVDAPLIDWLRRAGQMSLTLYIAHALVFNLVVDWLDWVGPTGLDTALLFSAGFWIVGIARGRRLAAPLRARPARRRSTAGSPSDLVGGSRCDAAAGRPDRQVISANVSQLTGSADVEPAAEPFDALLRRSVRNGLGVDPALRLLLDPVVTDGRRGAERLLDLLRVVQLASVGGAARPRARQTVGLQLERDRVLVGAIGVVLLRLVHLGVDAEHVLHVVAVLVGDDVLGGEVTGGAELVLELQQEVEVEVHEVVEPGSRTGRSATTPGRSRCW